MSLGAISIDLLSQLHHQFFNFNIAAAGMIPVTKFFVAQANSDEEEPETS